MNGPDPPRPGAKDEAAPRQAPSIKRLHGIIAGAVGEAAFSKTGPVWSRRGPESVMLIHPQKSQWSDLYYLELAADFFPPEGFKHPGAHIADVQVRLERLVPEDRRPRVQEALDFENSLSDAARREIIEDALRTWGLPFLDAYSTREGVRRARAESPNPQIAIRRRLADTL